MKFIIPFILLITSAISAPIKINLVTTNDIHGMIASQKATFMNPQYPPTIVGAAAFSKYVDELRISAVNDGEGLLVLDGGNIFQGNPPLDSTFAVLFNGPNYSAIEANATHVFDATTKLNWNPTYF